MDFVFPSNTRFDLWNRLEAARLPHEQIDSFVNRCQVAISRWQEQYPLKKVRPDDIAYRLKMLGAHIDKLRRDILCLTGGAEASYWAFLAGCANWQKKRDEVVALLSEMHQATGCEQAENARYNGYQKRRHAELVRCIALVYFEEFKRKPASTPSGPFFESLSFIGDALNLELGKSLVATVIRECSPLFEDRSIVVGVQ